jgi:hypothetical protein
VATAGAVGDDERRRLISVRQIREDRQHINNEHENQISAPAARFFDVTTSPLGAALLPRNAAHVADGRQEELPRLAPRPAPAGDAGF